MQGEFNNESDVPVELTDALQNAGFSYLSWGLFNQIRPQDNTMTMIERVDTLIHRMHDMGLNQLLIEADWSRIIPPITNIDPGLTPTQITSDTITAYIAEIEAYGGWTMMTDLINTAKQQIGSEIPISSLILAVGVGHEKRPPQYNGLHIAPGDSVVGDSAHLFVAVPENVYLYWLKKFTWAVVRQYKGDIYYWQAENELNAAKYTESFDWWRKGSAWRDDSPNGFQDTIAEMLYQIITFEDTDAEVIQAFHIFEAARRIKEWRQYYDIVGLHLYPHLKNSYPNFGFFTGEFVWAARRLLTSLGDENKPVWMLETGFAAETANPPNEDLIGFTEERQAEYIKEAFKSCEQYGAGGFNWWTIQSWDEPGHSGQGVEETNDYIGFFTPGNAPKDGYYAYRDVFREITEGSAVTFSNMYQTTDTLEGTFDIRKAISGVPSGATIHLNMIDSFLVETNDRFLARVSLPADTLQHFNWNNVTTEYFVNHMFKAAGQTNTQNANFNYTFPLEIETDISGQNDMDAVKQFEIRDPWLRNGEGEYPFEFYSLQDAVDTTFYNMFQNMFPQATNLNIPYYSIRPLEVVYYEDNLAVFKDWSAVQDVSFYNDPRKSGDMYQKAVVVTGTNPQIQAEYYFNIVPDGCQIFFENNHYTIKAAQAFATQDSLYEFLEWKVYESDGVTENSSKVNINSPSDFKSVVTFNTNGSNTVIRPRYRAINGINNYWMSLQDGEVLIVPEGANIHFAENFMMNVYGDIEFEGTVGNEIVLSMESTSWYLPFIEFEPQDGDEMTYKQTRSKLENVHFKNIKYPITFSSSGWPYNKKITINRCVFGNAENSITFGESFDAENIVEIENCTFYSAPVNDMSTSFVYPFTATYSIFYNSPCTGKGRLHHNVLYPNSFGSQFDYCISYEIFDPQFVDASNSNFRLQWGSPCIDTDMGLTDTDPDGTPRDIGAYYYAQLKDTIKTDLTLSGEVRIVDNLYIPDSVTVIVNPGTTVKLETNVSIYVYGKFIAEGTQDSMITFTSVHDNPETSDYWYRIRFYDSANDSSIIKYCNIEYAKYAVYTAYADISIESNVISNVRYHGLYCFESGVTIKNNDIQATHFGIYLYRGNYASKQTVVYGNKLHGGSRGLYMVYSSPYLQDNEIYDNDYGIYALSYSAAYLGWLGQEGRNHIHDNDYNLRSSRSAVFMGRDMCQLSGGKNKMENFSQYQIYATSNSHIIAENNWWGGAPQPADFNIDGTSSLDYTPYLSAPPLFKTGASPEESAFDDAFSGAATDSALTEAEVMANFKETWPIKQKLLYARNLVYLNFPQNAEKICKDIIQTCPDSSLSYLGLNILWEAGQVSAENFELFKIHLDSICAAKETKEIYDEAEFIRDGFNDEEALEASLGKAYMKYSYPQVAAQALFRDFLFVLYNKENINGAQGILNTLKDNYPESPFTEEAQDHFAIFMADFEREAASAIPREYKLYANYPNPFNPKTTFKFGLPVDSRITIDIYNVLGQKVYSLSKKSIDAGTHTLRWNGRNSSGLKLPSGLYIYRFEAQALQGKKREYFKSRKMILLK